MEAASREAYRSLVYDDPGFWPFYLQATPIEHIALLTIASRPVSRGGGGVEGVEGLRAIPWNFAWVQSRATLVGWYGLGTALQAEIGAGRPGRASTDVPRVALLQHGPEQRGAGVGAGAYPDRTDVRRAGGAAGVGGADRRADRGGVRPHPRRAPRDLRPSGPHGPRPRGEEHRRIP